MLSTIATEECLQIMRKLSTKIDITNDLPACIFREENLDYWFFERSLLGDLDLFEGLLVESHAQFGRAMGVLFSWSSADCKGRLFDGKDPEASALELKRQQVEGDLAHDLPNLYFDTSYEWLAYESSFEEWGVLAMDRALANTPFASFLNREFMNIAELWRLSTLDDFNGKLSRAFLRSYAHD